MHAVHELPELVDRELQIRLRLFEELLRPLRRLLRLLGAEA